MKENQGSFHLTRKGKSPVKNEMIKRIYLIGIVAIAIGTVLSIIIGLPLPSILTYSGGLAVIIVTFFMQRKSAGFRDIGVLISISYFAFIYIPVDWYIYGGLLGSTPYISILVLLVMVLAVSKRKQRIIVPIFFIVLVILCAYSITTLVLTKSENITEVIITLIAYLGCLGLLVFMRMSMLSKLENLYHRTFDDSIKDKLTGVLNRRGLDDIIKLAEEKYIEKYLEYTLVMIDIDKFKDLNDRHGHKLGDLVLKRFADCVTKSIRTVDYVLRYGGDEFILLLQSIPREKMGVIFTRIEGFLDEEYKEKQDFKVSFSRGFVERSECVSKDDMVEIADKRMYNNKFKSR